jgi:TPR repeat protein
MGRRIQAILDWSGRKLDAPTQDEVADFYGRWDWAQTNEQEIANDDPCADEVSEAISARKEDPSAAFGRLLALAERGSLLSMRHTAWMYAKGVGVEQDHVQAEEWERRAMEAGSLAALLNYGRYSWDRKDWDACESIYGVGSAMGWAPAQCRLALACLERSRTKSTFAEVRPLLETAAGKGSPRALYNLAWYLIKGYAGLAGILQGLRIVPRLAAKEMSDHDVQKQAAAQPSDAE